MFDDVVKFEDTTQILEHFRTLHIEPHKILHVEIYNQTLEDIGYKAFVDLAQIFFMKMLTPEVLNQTTTLLKFNKLNQHSSFHKTLNSDEKYGTDSEFFTINKTYQPSFLYYYQEALKFVNIKEKKTILNLGVNKGDEFKVIQNMLTCEEFESKKFVGIDYSKSAIDYAKEDFKDLHVEFICADINKLHELFLGRFELLVSIGTLQSSNMSFNQIFMNLYQNHLEKGGAIILGFPNCRWIDGEMVYGAKAPNYVFNEMSLVLKDIHFCKKYLQQKGYRVVVTGKDYLFLSARKLKTI